MPLLKEEQRCLGMVVRSPLFLVTSSITRYISSLPAPFPLWPAPFQFDFYLFFYVKGPPTGQDVAGGAVYSIGGDDTIIVGSTFSKYVFALPPIFLLLLTCSKVTSAAMEGRSGTYSDLFQYTIQLSITIKPLV